MADHVRTDAEPDVPPTGARRWPALAIVSLGLAMVLLDGTVVGVSLPAIIGDLGLDFTQAQWVFCVYSVVLAVLLITVGRIADRFGRRAILALGVLVFVGGSVLAASADSASPLIWGRLVQGIGGAAVVAGSVSTVSVLFRGRARAVAFTVWATASAAAAVVGAALGGWFTNSFTWPWIFLINVPIGVVVLIGTLVLVPETRIGRAATGLDVDGWLLSTAGFALVIFALIEGQRYGWWRPRREFTLFGLTWSVQSASSVIPFVLGVGVLLLVLFFFWERHRVRVEHAALMDFSRLSDPRRWSDGAAMLVAAAQFAVLFALPLYLVNCLGLSPLRTGSILVVLTGCALIAGVLTAGPARAIPPLWLVRVGLAIALLAIAVTALALTATISAWVPTVLLACYGVGLGLAVAPLTVRVRTDLWAGASDPGSVTALTARPAGAALGVAVLGSTLSIGLGHFLPDRLGYVPGLAPRAAAAVAAATRDSAGGAIVGLRGQHAPAAVTDALANGFADATRVMLLGVAVALLLAFVAASRIPLDSGQIDADMSVPAEPPVPGEQPTADSDAGAAQPES
ncbi:MFS transporter [Nocardia veterana]|uniref:MFS transporter n=1 Tax=Nocardia veterana TaxID=132249 RepID=A0A7X6RGZ6_9NOCA|nr:MFS transporter [Nocardia veterana]NKY84994.1 MFS transporter [Nocardia veterana]